MAHGHCPSAALRAFRVAKLSAEPAGGFGVNSNILPFYNPIYRVVGVPRTVVVNLYIAVEGCTNARAARALRRARTDSAGLSCGVGVA